MHVTKSFEYQITDMTETMGMSKSTQINNYLELWIHSGYEYIIVENGCYACIWCWWWQMAMNELIQRKFWFTGQILSYRIQFVTSVTQRTKKHTEINLQRRSSRPSFAYKIQIQYKIFRWQSVQLNPSMHIVKPLN